MRFPGRAAAVLALLVALLSGCALSGAPARRLVDDVTISDRVHERLARANPALAAIDIDTYEGTVYLNGPVESQAAKREAEALAKDVADVQVVVNNLHVPAMRGASGSPSTTGGLTVIVCRTAAAPTYTRTVKSPWLAVGIALVLATTAHAAPDLTAPQALPRVEHHVREVEHIAQHFATVMQSDCRRFASPAQWRSYFDGEIDQMVLMMAHLEQAWVEAKRTGDDDVRRVAKAPRRRMDDARALVDKLQGCAADNGATFVPMQVWRQIEREVPRRQTEIALPDAPASAAPSATPVSQ